MSETIKLETIEKLQTLMGDKFPVLVSTFKTKIEKQLTELIEAIEQQQQDEIISLTHSIKGSCGSLGATRMYEISMQYEMDAKQNNLQGSKDWVATLSSEYQQFLEALPEY